MQGPGPVPLGQSVEHGAAATEDIPGKVEADGPVAAGIVIIPPVVIIFAEAGILVAGIHSGGEFPHGDMGVLVSYSHAFLRDDQVRAAVECRFYGLVFRVGDDTMKILQPAGIGDALMG